MYSANISFGLTWREAASLTAAEKYIHQCISLIYDAGQLMKPFRSELFVVEAVLHGAEWEGYAVGQKS